MHDITETRLGNSRVRMIKNFKKAIGNTAVNNIMIITTKWDLVNQDVGNRRYDQLIKHPKAFGPLMKFDIPVIKYRHDQDPADIIQKLVAAATK